MVTLFVVEVMKNLLIMVSHYYYIVLSLYKTSLENSLLRTLVKVQYYPLNMYMLAKLKNVIQNEYNDLLFFILFITIKKNLFAMSHAMYSDFFFNVGSYLDLLIFINTFPLRLMENTNITVSITFYNILPTLSP